MRKSDTTPSYAKRQRSFRSARLMLGAWSLCLFLVTTALYIKLGAWRYILGKPHLSVAESKQLRLLLDNQELIRQKVMLKSTSL